MFESELILVALFGVQDHIMAKLFPWTRFLLSIAYKIYEQACHSLSLFLPLYYFALYLPHFVSIFKSCRTGRVCNYFSADQRGSHPVRGNIVNAADTVPSAYFAACSQ